jgi:beta-phosphoglucomutase-like phosphatase (HAD superfamily)
MNDRMDLVIFDCTLVDSEVLSIRVDQRVLADHGWNLSQEEIVSRFMGRTSTHFTNELESFLGRVLAPGWELKYQQWYADAFERELAAVAGVEKALSRILLPTCVASNSSHARLEKTLGITGLLPRFSGSIFRRRTSGRASLLRTSFSTRHKRWVFHRRDAWSLKTVDLVFRPHALRACGSSATPVA